ncbi:MAG: matrixin family metalloprotease [Candidatus Nezhaarchaeales archaeon]
MALGPARASTPSIELIGAAWDRFNLSVYILADSVPSEYIDAVREAFRVWDSALEAFGNSYGYRYLSNFNFSIRIVCLPPKAYDILVNFTLSPSPSGELGRATIYYRDGRVEWVDIVLHLYYGATMLGPGDVYNIALHEIGHALGLGHTESRESENGPELMYPMYPYSTGASTRVTPTTLDAYGVAVAHEWAVVGRFSKPSRTTAYLPPGVPYRMLLFHKVTVKSPYGSAYGGGWYLEGSEVKVGVEETVVSLGERERAVFIGWAGIPSSDPSITIVVDRDYEIEALWKLQYYVEIVTPFSRATATSGWYDAGSVIEVGLEDYLIPLGNATRRVFVKWAGDVESPERVVVVSVDRPLTLTASWKTQYYVEVSPGYGSASIESGWYDEGLEALLYVHDVLIYCGNGTRWLFKHWIINGAPYEGASVRLRFDKPYVISARWIREYEVSIQLLDLDLSEVNGTALLSSGEGDVLAEGGSLLWLREGEWRVGRVAYIELPRVSALSPEPSPLRLEAEPLEALVDVLGPGPIIIRLAVSRVDVYVRDILGIPCPLVTINLGGLVNATSDLHGFALSIRLPRAPHVAKLALAGLPLGSVDIDAREGGAVVVVVPLSIYTGLMILAALAVTLAAIRRRGRAGLGRPRLNYLHPSVELLKLMSAEPLHALKPLSCLSA